MKKSKEAVQPDEVAPQAEPLSDYQTSFSRALSSRGATRPQPYGRMLAAPRKSSLSGALRDKPMLG